MAHAPQGAQTCREMPYWAIGMHERGDTAGDSQFRDNGSGKVLQHILQHNMGRDRDIRYTFRDDPEFSRLKAQELIDHLNEK